MNHLIPISLYFKLRTAYRKGSVKIPTDYKHLDLIHQDKLLVNDIIDYKSDSVDILVFMEPVFSDEYKITTAGKNLLISINWRIFFVVFGLIITVLGWRLFF